MSTNKLAIDLGTANTVVIVQGKGIVIQEPTVVAISLTQRKVLAVGAEAQQMLGKVPKGIEARRPMRQGTIASYQMTEALLKRFIDKAVGRIRIFRPEVVISVPYGLNSVEERAVMQALRSAGAAKITLVPEPLAAAIGAGLPITEPNGSLIINMGGGTSEVAVISLNGIVAAVTERTAGDALTVAITEYLRKQYKLSIGELTAESIKKDYATALELTDPEEFDVSGTHAITGLPTTVKINANELVKPLRQPLNKILEAIHSVLSKTPPELAADITDFGGVLSGGTAMLRNIDVLFTKALGIPMHVVEEPLTCVVRGLDIILSES